jgi:general secretion pathway protein J
MAGQSQRGLTLLEVLIALSIFSLVGVASYQVLNTTITSQRSGDSYSQLLGRQQKALMIIDRDLQQIIARPVRISSSESAAFLQVNSNDYPLEFTRGGRRNPLMLPRSSLQRIAYDVGLHPQVADRDSRHYQDEQRYLRRHVWTALDRPEMTTALVQALLPAVTDLQVSVLTKQGRKAEWPMPVNSKNKQASNSKPLQPLGLELILTLTDEQQIRRIYPVL